ncbi:sugar-phosphatase [Photobacterium aphoticum]|uniref:HAD family hydrolase n=2 Tax=Photobacterium aphoticum TaxID=754436 RepID=A0A0J1GP61_9GAMM|nr:sugar-phosphatase [Photobacterium aphoticum]KLV01189.1 HAD family hydrolase [Photobacterium aphoticum]PSU56117.1 Cof-type HAD-IIB family hydrolase [Photobacterium aphoticum]GHA49563.1 hydrolase [Photobacterium aphoticum]
MYKLVALDMDGTLLNSQKAISPRTKQAIHAAREQGVHVVLASGRPLEGMTKYLDELEMRGENDYVLSYNASLVQRIASKTVIRKQIMTGLDAKNIASLANDFGTFVHAFSPERGLITPQNNPYTQHESEINDVAVTEVDFSTLSDDEEIIKVMMIADPEVLSAAIAQLPASLYEQYTVVQSAPFFLELMNPNSNKGTGVAMLAEHLGLSAENVICMGDAGNDHHMIAYAGLGVAMGNATDDIKAIANHITDTNDNDGVAKVIEQFILNK